MSRSLGRHLLAEFYGCSIPALNDAIDIEGFMLAAAKAANATVINSTFHHFSPYGVSGVVVIEESHLAIHTWPEYRYAAVDLFTCGDAVDPWIAFKVLENKLEADNASVMELLRGQTGILKAAETDLPDLRRQATERLPADEKFSAWLTDRNDDLALSVRYKSAETYRTTSDYQTIEVFNTYAYGKMLALDKRIMYTERDEHAYHEMMAHVPVAYCPDVEDVLIIGGGDAGVLKEVLKYELIKQVTVAELDRTVPEVVSAHFQDLKAAFKHPKTRVVIAEAAGYCRTLPDACYDLILVDSVTANETTPLDSRSFYDDIARLLRTSGAAVFQTDSPMNAERFKGHYERLKRAFKAVKPYLVFMPTYPTGMWSMALCTNADLPAADDTHLPEGLKYYTPAVREAAFALPAFAEALLKPTGNRSKN